MNDSNSLIQDDIRRPAASVEALVGRRPGTHDGVGAGDHDQPFVGWRNYHFSTHQMVRLLLLRGEDLGSRLAPGRYSADLTAG